METPVEVGASAEKKPTRARSATARKRKSVTKSAAAKERKPVPPLQPSDEEIRMRAYFIAERRHRLGLPGDSNSDWLEAKRQLLSEFGPR